MKTIILGAGFSGMAAGIKTKAPIFEATDKAGGICNSYNLDGFEFFNGGPHLLFEKGPGLEYIKTLIPVKEYERNSGVYFNKIFPYPFQTFAQKPIYRYEGTLKHWLSDKFSDSENNLFFFPFNEKYTAGLYDLVIQDEDYKTPPAGSKGFAGSFCDPDPSLSCLVEKMANKCNIIYNKKAIKIDAIEKIVHFEKGGPEEYDRLISTIPLNMLMHLCGEDGRKLPFTSIYALNIGAKRTECTPSQHWLYVPFCRSGFHRISFYSNINPDKAPEGCVNLSVEIAFHGVDRSDLDEPFIAQEVIRELQQWGFIGDVIVKDGTWVPFAYTWLYDRKDRDEALTWLKGHEIISTGRYGKWKFQGLVKSIEDGLSITDGIEYEI